MASQLRKILLIEDSPDTGELIRETLKAIYEIRQAFSIKEAISALSNEEFSLLLIHVTLPDGNGFDFCQELSQDPLYHHLPLILLTAKAEVSDKIYGLNCGAIDYITKPFNTLELKARVDSHLRLHL